MTTTKKDALLLTTGLVVYSGVNTALKNSLVALMPEDLSLRGRFCIFVARVGVSLAVTDMVTSKLVSTILFTEKQIEKSVDQIKNAFNGVSEPTDTST